MADVLFDAEALLTQARAATGLENFGADHFREGLQVLLETYDRNVQDPGSRNKCRETVQGRLITRLKMQAAFDRHPEILDIELKTPMFVTGLPRTGTSALVNLLASDPATKALLLWEIHYPEPLEGLKPGAPDPRHMGMVEYMEANRNPEFDRIHYAHPDLPEECVMMHAYSFDGVQTGWEIMLEPYSSWFQNHDLKPLYREFRDYLKLLQWQRPGERWLLKAPAHMWALPEIVELFPDVSVVWGHRDVVGVTSSICSMTHMIMGLYMYGGKPAKTDAKQLGPTVMEWYARSLERGMADREKLPAERFTDYTHDGFVEDSMVTAAAIYAHFGMEMTSAIISALQAHMDAHPQNKHGKHQHKLDQFGMSEERVRERFDFYLKDNPWL
ncbi:MAG: sulfotransferase [Gammaproteobacteria bacterium]|nr:sulfotransferase [Gammaproteobacteria bacterium]